MNKSILFFLLFVASITLFGQATKEVHLKPIYKQGLRYYYNFRKVDGGAYGLQIPLQSLEDDEVNKRYKKFKNLRKIEAVVSFIPLAYLLSAPTSISFRHRNQLNSNTTFYEVSGGSIAAIIGLEILAHHQLKKAIDRYNSAILERNTLGFVVVPVENQAAIGLGFSHKF